MGRKRKQLIEKSTVLMIRVDNKTIFDLCDKLNIEYDPEAEMLQDSAKKALIGEIKNNLEKITK